MKLLCHSIVPCSKSLQSCLMQMLLGFQMPDVLYAFSLVASAGGRQIVPLLHLLSPLLWRAPPAVGRVGGLHDMALGESLLIIHNVYISSWRFCALEGKCTYPRTLALVPRPPKLQVGDSKHHKHLRMFQIMLWHPLSGFLPVHLKIYVCRRTAQLGVAPGLLRLFLSPCPHEDPADALETNRKLHSFVQHQSVWSGSKGIKKYRSWISMKRVQLKDIERFWKDPYTDPLPLRIRKDL